jgi:hypothetical protein
MLQRGAHALAERYARGCCAGIDRPLDIPNTVGEYELSSFLVTLGAEIFRLGVELRFPRFAFASPVRDLAAGERVTAASSCHIELPRGP